jgi:hypothetical protein
MTELDAYAAGGGLLVNVLGLLELGKVPKEQRPNFSDWLYWLPFAVWPVAAFALAHAYSTSGATMSALLSLNVGLSAPLIIKAMASAVPPVRSFDPKQGQ